MTWEKIPLNNNGASVAKFAAVNLCHDAGIAYADVENKELHFIEMDRLTGVPHHGYYGGHGGRIYTKLDSVIRDEQLVVLYRVWLTATHALGLHDVQWLLSPVNRSGDRRPEDGLDGVLGMHESWCHLTHWDGVGVDHQRAHAADVVAVNNMTDGTVVVLDGMGDGCGAVFTVNASGDLIELHRRRTCSLGELYEVLTKFFVGANAYGLALGREGTFMAFAGLGKPIVPMNAEWLKIIKAFTTDYPWAGGKAEQFMYSMLTELVERYDKKDVAATCHQLWVDLAEEYVLMYADQTKPLALAGGSALNCALNARLARRWGGCVCWSPTPGDCGQPVGMVVHELMQRGVDARGWRLRTTGVLDDVQVTGGVADPEHVAQMLVSGQVVATMRGEVEAGPRALGRRSILASPLVTKHRQLLNIFKGREEFRPFGVIIPREHMVDFTDMDVDAPWMNLTVDVERGQVPAAVHADGTVRVQTVTAQADPWLHALVTAFGDATGVYAVINTSLNTKGKAIFNRVGDALELLGHGVDALVVDDVLVT